MNGEGLRFVIDASVIIKLLVDEPLSDRADRLFEQLAENFESSFFVPDLLYIECANVLWKYTRRFGMTETEAKEKLEEIYSLAVVAIPIVEHLPKALEIAIKNEISVYDGCYIAVAVFVKAPLVTADDKLVAKMSVEKTPILSLAEIDLPEED